MDEKRMEESSVEESIEDTEENQDKETGAEVPDDIVEGITRININESDITVVSAPLAESSQKILPTYVPSVDAVANIVPAIILKALPAPKMLPKADYLVSGPETIHPELNKHPTKYSIIVPGLAPAPQNHPTDSGAPRGLKRTHDATETEVDVKKRKISQVLIKVSEKLSKMIAMQQDRFGTFRKNFKFSNTDNDDDNSLIMKKDAICPPANSPSSMRDESHSLKRPFDEEEEEETVKVVEVKRRKIVVEKTSEDVDVNPENEESSPPRFVSIFTDDCFGEYNLQCGYHTDRSRVQEERVLTEDEDTRDMEEENDPVIGDENDTSSDD